MSSILLVQKQDIENRFKNALAELLNNLPYDNVKIEINANKKENSYKIKIGQFFNM